METIGQFIRRKRKEKGIGVRELSRRVDISHSYLSQIENDVKKEPKSYILKVLAQELDIDSNELLDRFGYKVDPLELPLITSVFESNKKAFEKDMSIPVFTDKHNNINIQIYRDSEYLNEEDSDELNSMIKGFLYNKKFKHIE